MAGGKVQQFLVDSARETLIQGVFSIVKDNTAQALKVHFGGVGKNDERIFATEVLRLDPTDQQTILSFLGGLADWQQIQFILFVAEMPGPTTARLAQKGQPPTPAQPGDRQPFLKGLAALSSDQERIHRLEILHAFSPVSISRLLAEITGGAKGLRVALANQGWKPNWAELTQKTTSWRDKLADAVEKSANKGRK